MSLPISFPLLLALALPATAQGAVWTVDDDGGPGVAFTTIGAAVAAASDGDLIVVRDGTYPGFVLLGRSLSVVADVDAAPVVGLSAVEQTSTSDRVVLRGLTFRSTGSCSGPGLYVDFGSGRNWLEGCDFGGCQGLWVNGSPLGTTTAIRCTTSPTFADGVRVMNGATVLLLDCETLGADGGNQPDGLEVGDGTVILDGGAVRGGAGAFGSCTTCDDGGQGGDGLRQFGGEVHVRGTTFDEGLGGGACCAPGLPGAAGLDLELFGGSFQYFYGASRSLVATSPVPLGGTSTFTLEGQAGDFLFLLYHTGQRARFFPALGSLLLENGYSTFLVGPTPGGPIVRTFSFPPVPAGTFLEFFVQVGGLATDGTVGLGSGTVLHLLGNP